MNPSIVAVVTDLVRPAFLNGSLTFPPPPHSAMNSMDRHQDKPAIYLTNEAFLWSHRFYVLGKVMQLRPASVVDLGCGEGYVLRDLRHNRVLVPFIGIDIRNCLRTDQNSAFVQAHLSDKSRWPLFWEKSDCLVLSEVIEHFSKEDGTRLIARAMASLKRGGHLIVTLPVKEPAVSADEDYRKFGHIHYWDVPELLALFEKHGGEVVEKWGARFCRDHTSNTALKKLVTNRKCPWCEGRGVVNTFDGKDTGSNTAENWPGPCPECNGSAGFSPEKAAGVLWLMDQLEAVYGVRVFKHLFAFLRPVEEASGLNCLIKKID